jgi:hypothetical protein
MNEIISIDNLPQVQYCIPLELRDEQIKLAIKRVKERVIPAKSDELNDEPIVIVCFGPSLKKTWPKLKKFKTKNSIGKIEFFVLYGKIY